MIDCVEKQQQHQQPLQNYRHQQPPQLQLLNTATSQMSQSGAQQPSSLLVMYHQQQRQQPIAVEPAPPNQHQSGNELIGYYFGSISRETAEWILKTHGNQLNGAYLLRSSGPNDDFVLSLLIAHNLQSPANPSQTHLEVLHYKIVETEDSFVALHGQVGDEKFSTIDELIDKAQGVATKPMWPMHRQLLESQILPPTYWGLTVDQVRLAILIKAKQWGFPLLSSLFQVPQQLTDQSSACNGASIEGLNSVNATTLNNETIRTLIYKSLHEFQPWFHGKISREEAERRIEDGHLRDGRFLVRERDNFSYAMCISHKKTTKHYRIDVLPTGELAIQDGRKFTSLMALVSHYTIMSDGLWCALTEACPRPIGQATNGFSRGLAFGQLSGQAASANQLGLNLAQSGQLYNPALANQNLYCVPPSSNRMLAGLTSSQHTAPENGASEPVSRHSTESADAGKCQTSLICAQQGGINSIRGPIREWLQTINHKWSQLIAVKNQHQSLNSFLFGNQNPLNNHCRHSHRSQHHVNHRRKCKSGHTSCGCIQQLCASRAAPISQYRAELANSGQVMTKFKEINPHSFGIRNASGGLTKAHSCCTGALCPKPSSKHITAQTNSCDSDQPTTGGHPISGPLLAYSPAMQNLGFSGLNGQSFVGSPLFAVKPVQQDNAQQVAGGGSSNSGSSGRNNVEEERLISPAQSVAANLNNPYTLNADIYGSQTSTALVNDPLPTSSSSSSGTNMVQPLKKPYNPPLQLLYGPQPPTKLVNADQVVVPQQQQPIVGQAGPILCGQHAGPAYRYTNCSDENSCLPCLHRSRAAYRAADDSQLLTHSTQLASSAAMAKFVQFQDGQCLRTHRDTRSIQMAYLSARQAPHNNRGNNENLSRASQVPLRELRSQQQQQQSGMKYHMKKNTFENVSNIGTKQLAGAAYLGSNGDNRLNQSELTSRAYHGSGVASFRQRDNEDIDLMDCSEDSTFGPFRYDPKLIKSSSIETLCGAVNEAEGAAIESCKSNAELLGQLQSCWEAQQQQAHNILCPVMAVDLDENLENEHDNEDSLLLSSVLVESGPNEQLDHMKKKHDLDELTTALLAELTASLKAQVDLKNKRSGFSLHSSEKLDGQSSLQHGSSQQEAGEQTGSVRVNPIELINEFDTLISNCRR